MAEHLTDKPALQIPGIRNHELIELDFPKVIQDRVTLDIPIEGVMTSVNPLQVLASSDRLRTPG